MSVPLSPEQASAISAHPGEPLEVVDVSSRARYVLLPAEQFDRMRAILEIDLTNLRETYLAQEHVLGKAGWDDPEMDVYNDYDAHRS